MQANTRAADFDRIAIDNTCHALELRLGRRGTALTSAPELSLGPDCIGQKPNVMP
jgi:hypothetical protein